MGRESRQSRRARERRQTQMQAHRKTQSGPIANRTAFLAGIGVVAAAVIVFIVLASGMLNGGSHSANAQPAEAPGKTVGVVGCGSSTMSVTYHVHAHVDIYVHGKAETIPPYIGFNVQHDCLYWTHTHDPSYNIIHVESPHKIQPPLGDFFDIWGVPLSRTQVWKYKVQPGDSMRVYVNEKLYTGDPREIPITRHKDITFEIGPPWVTPKPYSYGQL